MACLMLAMMIFVSFGPLSERGIGTGLAEAVPAVKVTVDCDTNPEKTRAMNKQPRHQDKDGWLNLPSVHLRAFCGEQ